KRELSVGSSLKARFTFGYDNEGRKTQVSRAAGSTPVGTSSLSYDTNGRLTLLSHKNASSSTLASFGYGYNAGGEVTSVTGTDGANYQYDAAGQLTRADYSSGGGESFTYDLNGNRTGADYQSGNPNLITSDDIFNYSYDGDGNLNQKVRRSSGEVT